MNTHSNWVNATALSRTFLVCALGLVLAATTAHAENKLVDQVIQLHKANLDTKVIKDVIKSSSKTAKKLTLSDLKKLKAAGVNQAVIDYMKNPTSSAPAPAPAPEPAPEAGGGDELEELRKMEERENQQIEADARLREAERQAREQMRKKMRAEERRKTATALEGARNAQDDGKFAKSAQLYDAFLQKAVNPNSASSRDARLGFADSLFGLKLYGNAAKVYQSLLSAGPDSDVFVPAFEGLRKCAKEIAYNPVTLESLANHFVGSKKQAFKDSYNYFLGKFFFDYNRYDESKKYLNEVGAKGVDYPGAQYLLGLIQVAEAGDNQDDPDWGKRLIAANRFFQGAIVGAETLGQPRIEHLSYLALGRIAYSLSLYGVAIYYYRKIPYDSTSYVNALHESGWSYFLRNDFRRGLGIFHTLDGPDWEKVFLPDMHLLEAAVYMTTCHFKYAHDALKRIDSRFLSLRQPLERFTTTHASPEMLYEAFVLKNVKNGADLPRKLRLAVMANPEFNDLYLTATQYRREVARIDAKAATLGNDLSARLLKTVDSAKQSNAIGLGVKIGQVLQSLADELDSLEVQKTEIQIEIDETEAQELESSIEQINRGTSAATAEADAQETASIFVGDQYVTWPFEGEFWADEINSYRSDLKEVCKQ